MTIRSLEPLLAEHPFLKGLDPEHLTLLAGCASNVVFQPGEYLIREGDEARSFFVIRHGRVSVETSAPGRGALAVQTLGPGEILGWSWLVPPYRNRFDGRALEQVRAIALDGECLRGKCEADPRLGYELLKRFSQVMVGRLEATRLQLMDLYGVQG
jgi:CRP/FNR family transcriptional regulator, cyclic AMP receptor protein